ncbi:MAG TPA: hypothetical protein VFH48_30705, partial [Chloroflexota bacterium]|nr:hypothetical protein [Chloroflexota bacterium]
MALTVLAHPIYVTLDRLAGIPNLARLLGHSFIVLAAWSARSTLSYVNYPFEEAQSRVRRHGAILVVALVLMSVLFGLAPVDEETIQFMSTYATAPFILEYWLVFLGFLGVALIDIVRLDFAHSARAENPAVKLGLRTVALGGIVGLGYVANWLTGPPQICEVRRRGCREAELRGRQEGVMRWADGGVAGGSARRVPSDRS